MGESIQQITEEEITDFKKRVENVSCKFIYDKMKKKVDSQMNDVISLLEKEYDTKRTEYLFERERSKEMIPQFQERDRDVIAIDTKNSGHAPFVDMYICCGAVDRDSEGCQSYTNTSTTSFMFWSSTSTYTDMKHEGRYMKACPKCRKDYGPCSGTGFTTAKETFKEFTHNVVKYNMNDWTDDNFKAKAQETIKKIQTKFKNNKN